MPPQNILLVRNDKLGDFMLAWPALALLKQSLPQARVHALVPAYTAPMAALCPWIDAVVTDPGPETAAGRWTALARTLREHRFDAVITLFSTTRVGAAVWAARIPYRLAPATKLAQLFYNRRLTQRRSRSEKPEYEYNRDLVRRALADWGVEAAADAEPPLLRFDAGETTALRRAFCAQRGLDAAARLVFIHPGSGGSANNLAPAQYAELARRLRAPVPLAFVISAGPGELPAAEALAADLGEHPHTIYRSDQGLEAFSRHLAFADLFISGSTGPLHIASALDRPTAAFYPRRRSATPLRWQTTNRPDHRLAFTPPPESDETDVGAIDIATAAETISARLLAKG